MELGEVDGSPRSTCESFVNVRVFSVLYVWPRLEVSLFAQRRWKVIYLLDGFGLYCLQSK